MAVFRRPELEKDNPIAPQMYVGPRRRRALLREASLSPASRQGDMAETLQALTTAAERFVARCRHRRSCKRNGAYCWRRSSKRNSSDQNCRGHC